MKTSHHASDWKGVRLTGDRELDRALAMLPDRMQRKVIRAVVAAQASVFMREVRRRAPTRSRKETYTSKTGKTRRRSIGLRRSITKKAWSKPDKGMIGQIVGARWPEGAHAHLVEYGHWMVTHDGNTVGLVREQPFQRPAEAAAQGRMLSRGAQVARSKIPALAADVLARATRG